MGATERTLIIPDIHTKFQTAEIIIDRESADRVVFLGDYFDRFNETYQDTEGTARWLAKSLQCKGRLHIVGNHDLSYMTANPLLKCSGFSEYKKFIIDRHHIPWEKLLPYCYVGDYLCTHAGLGRRFFEQYSIKDVKEFMMEADDELGEINDADYNPRFFQAGRSRGGQAENGGIVWCDYDEFEDISGIGQIFGHTNGDRVRHAGNHWCLDTGLRHYAIHEKNTLTVKTT